MRLTPDLAARFGRGLLVSLVLLFFPAAALLASMACAWSTAHPSPKHRGKSNAQHLAASWVWLRPGLDRYRFWLASTALPVLGRCGWWLLALLCLALLSAWTGARLLALGCLAVLIALVAETLRAEERHTPTERKASAWSR